MDNQHRSIGGVGRGAPVGQAMRSAPGGGSGGFGGNTGGGFASDRSNFNDDGKSGFGNSGRGGGSGFGGGNQGGFGAASGGGFGASSGGGFGAASGGGFGSNEENSFGGGGGGRSFGGGGRGGGGGQRSDNACRKCGKDGHFARDCTEPGMGGGGGARTCHKCGQEGHISRDCTQGGGGSGFGGGGGARTCHKCGKEGHMSRECPEGGGGGGGNFGGAGFGSGGGGGGGPRTCHKCGQEGHISRECPEGGGGGGAGFGSGGGGAGFGGGGAGFGGGGGGGGPRTCRKCNKEGHMARECPEAGGGGGGFASSGGGFGGGFGGETGGAGFGGFGASDGGTFGGGGDDSRPRSGECRKCGEQGHYSRECPKGGGGGGGSGKCFNCDGEGHLSRDCTEPRKERTGGGGGKCFNCDGEGHMSKDCPNPPKEGEERKPASTHVPVEVADDVLWETHIAAGINFDRWYNIPVERSGSNIESIPKITSFDEAGLTPQLFENVKKAGYARPTPIQQNAIPIILSGRDLMGCAQTGSGKTAAFMLPILSAMMKSGDMTTGLSERQEPGAIVMAPTRELAIQIKEEARKFAIGTMAKVVVAYGGTSMRYQMEVLERGCNILVATPGRLMDIVEKGRVGLSKCKYLVLDEADRMLDLGFEQEVRKLVENSEMPPKTQRQTLMFSATFPSAVQGLAADFLNEHVFITVGKVGAANQDIVQELCQADKFSKKDKLQELVTADMENAQDGKGKYTKKTMIFVERKRTADFLATFLSQASVPATSIHGDRLQKEREEALSDFRKGTCPILVATGVAARGLDIKGVDHVINFDLPKDIEEYVHRIGRTGRVGNPGRATSLYDSSADSAMAAPLVTVLTDAQQNIPDWLAQDAGMGGGGGSYDFAADDNAGGGGGGTQGGDDW